MGLALHELYEVSGLVMGDACLQRKNSRKVSLNQLKVYNGLILRLQGREDVES